jgi:hypothetical protein
MKSIFTAAALLLACPIALHAQQVYRCGNSYSQAPCEGGTVVKVEDTRSKTQTVSAAADTKREAKAGEAMEKARLQQEAKAAPASVIEHTKSETATAPVAREKEIQPSSHAKKKGKKPDYFTAVSSKKAAEAKPVKASAKKPAKKPAGKSA